MMDSFDISVQLADPQGAAIELANVVVDAVLYIEDRVRYRFQAGETDAQGRCRLTFSRLEHERTKNRAVQIMDYNTPLQSCNSLISLIVPPADELASRREAIQKWFPENLASLKQLEESQNGHVRCAPMDLQTNSDKLGLVRLVCERLPEALGPNNSFKPKPLRGSA
jgi:hypothetical protein